MSEFQIISRKDAAAAGLKRYFTGKPCKRKHLWYRSVRSRGCMKCAVKHTRKYVKKNPSKKKIWDKNYYDKNPEKCRALSRIRGHRRDNLPVALYPMTSECEICGKTNFKRVLCLDHDHETGKFRGWLCDKCNNALGLFKDNIDTMRKAIAYLEKKHAS